MSIRQRKDGSFTGARGTVSAGQLAELLGLKNAPRPEPPMPDTPAAARLRAEGKRRQADALMEAAKEHHMIHTVQPGWEAMNALAVRAEELPVGIEAELGPPPPEPKPEPGWRPDGSYNGAVNAPEPSTAELAKAEELRAHYRNHAADVALRAEASRGDAAKEARAAAEVHEVAELGSKLKAKLAKLGMSL